MNITTCKICNKVYGQRYSLREHIKKCHPDKLEELAPPKIYKCSAICNECNKTFSTSFNLTQHIKNYHKDKLSELIKPKRYPYACDKCHRHFTHSRNLNYHKKSHGEQTSRGLSTLACILCRSDSDTEFFTEPGLIEHFRIRHNVNVIIKLLNFATFEEFNTWKKQEESKTNESFINSHGTHRYKKFAETQYICHRSGYYKSRGKQLRRLKTQGSKKINGYCPAKMHVKNIHEKFQVQYVSTHVGHSNDLGHLNLNEMERQTLAEQIAAKIPFEQILDEVRGSFNGTLERCHLLTKKDLSNIERSLNLNNSEARRHCNDAISVDEWVIEADIPYLTIDENVDTQEEIPIVTAPSVSKSNGNDNKFMTDKEKFKLELLRIVDSLECFEELDMVKKAVFPVVPTLTAYRNFKKSAKN